MTKCWQINHVFVMLSFSPVHLDGALIHIAINQREWAWGLKLPLKKTFACSPNVYTAFYQRLKISPQVKLIIDSLSLFSPLFAPGPPPLPLVSVQPTLCPPPLPSPLVYQSLITHLFVHGCLRRAVLWKCPCWGGDEIPVKLVEPVPLVPPYCTYIHKVQCEPPRAVLRRLPLSGFTVTQCSRRKY